ALVLALGSGLDYAAALAAANAVGADAVGDPTSQPALAPLEEYVARAAVAGVVGA
ncbi:MAG: PfkB domain protein, partial [Pseudarthrobacter sp.]|nr:PfkB domain protein [Pseudarthrobacter sp.]